MGRPEKPINPDAPAPVRRIAQGLRVQRHEAGLSYAQLADGVGCSASSLAAAASGDKLPSLAVTVAFASGCGGDGTVWKLRWLVAHAELHDLSQPSAPLMDGDLCGFANHLRALLRWRGLTSLAEIAEAARLSRATVFRALGGVLVPSSETVVRLLNAADLAMADQRPWLAARIRLLGLPSSVDEVFAEHEPERTTPTMTQSTLLDLQQLTLELRHLRRGRGVEHAELSGNVGSMLRAACGIPAGCPAHQLRSALVAGLNRAVATLPADQQLIAGAALNLPGAAPEYKHALFSTRVVNLARAFDRDPRTMQRRVQEVLDRIAEALVQLDQDGDADE
uniref:helix-turn-helix domain-containing protein n=1 Tax=Amycolatopsis sp. CA-082387 TaxID=3239918 RepID=UPI003F499B06